MYSIALGNEKKNPGGRSALVKIADRAADIQTPEQALVSDSRWTKFWDLMDTIEVHGYLRAAMGVIGRSAVGTWWNLRKHKEFRSSARELHRKKLFDFYMFSRREWDNIKDYYSMAYKVMIGVMYLRYFGFCAFQIVRDNMGQPLGLDFLHGYVVPNVDERGYFKSPAFIQYPTNDKLDKVEFENSRDIVYIVNPDWKGYPAGGSDLNSLTEYTLPLDVHLQTAAREYIQNRNTPESFFILSPDISDEAFDDFVEVLEAKYAGPANMGRSPVAVQGELDIRTVSKIPSDLPYQGTRDGTRMETLAAAGVSPPKLGIFDEQTNASFREARREFHETSMTPLFRMFELGMYEQVHIREFGFVGWEFSFNSPDFLTAVERATVDMRYHGIGVLSPNEIRHGQGRDAREDELGDMYADQLTNAPATAPNQPGSPPEGRPVEPDDPSQTGEPTLDDQDPPRGDNHDDEARGMIGEVRRYRRFVNKRIKNGEEIRAFKSTILPRFMLAHINKGIAEGNLDEINDMFSSVIGMLEEFTDGREKNNSMVLR